MVQTFKFALIGLALSAAAAASLGGLKAREALSVSAQPSVASSQIGEKAPATASQAEAPKIAANPACAAQTWPYVTAECLTTPDGMPSRQVRRIAIGAK